MSPEYNVPKKLFVKIPSRKYNKLFIREKWFGCGKTHTKKSKRM